MRNICTALLLLFLCQPSFSQDIDVKGVVVDNDGKAIPFATVAIKGTKLQTLTDAAGKFIIRVTKLPATVLVQAAGYEPAAINVRKENHADLKITLKQTEVSLAEVVVTAGYKVSDHDASVKSLSPMKESRAEHKGKKRVMGTGYSDGGRSRLLTAGELSDFKKWKLWGDYSTSEFSVFSDQWQLVLRKRYCVQVQNKTHRAIPGEKVYLIRRQSRDTVWSAMTDNTGKAELWGDFNTDENEQESFEMVAGDRIINYPVPFENGVNRITLDKPCAVSNIVDIAFVVDATGSMGDEIRYLQAELEDIIGNTSKNFADVKLRLGSVFYRDHGDEYLTRQTDFVDDPKSLIDFINNQHAGGGGDFPEAVEDALEVAVNNLRWSSNARTKILFLVLDAPPHDAGREKMKRMIVKAAAMGIRIVPIACSGINKSTEYLMRSAALATNGSYIFLTDDSGIGNPHIKPTTDEFKVELLNELLQRIIAEMIYTPSCNEKFEKQFSKDSLNAIVEVKLFPNPTTGRIVLESSRSLDQVYLSDFTGKLLMRMDTRDKKRRWVMHLNNYPSGTYLVRYFNEETGWGSAKIVLIH